MQVNDHCLTGNMSLAVQDVMHMEITLMFCSQFEWFWCLKLRNVKIFTAEKDTGVTEQNKFHLANDQV